jgi:hypothetical protein
MYAQSMRRAKFSIKRFRSQRRERDFTYALFAHRELHAMYAAGAKDKER